MLIESSALISPKLGEMLEGGSLICHSFPGTCPYSQDVEIFVIGE